MNWHDKVQRIKDEHYNQEYNDWVWDLQDRYYRCNYCLEDVPKLERHWTGNKFEEMCEKCLKLELE